MKRSRLASTTPALTITSTCRGVVPRGAFDGAPGLRRVASPVTRLTIGNGVVSCNPLGAENVVRRSRAGKLRVGAEYSSRLLSWCGYRKPIHVTRPAETPGIRLPTSDDELTSPPESRNSSFEPSAERADRPRPGCKASSPKGPGEPRPARRARCAFHRSAEMGSEFARRAPSTRGFALESMASVAGRTPQNLWPSTASDGEVRQMITELLEDLGERLSVALREQGGDERARTLLTHIQDELGDHIRELTDSQTEIRGWRPASAKNVIQRP